MSEAPRARSFSTTCEPRKPAPPVTRIRLASQKFMVPGLNARMSRFQFEVRIDHHPDQFAESHFRRPPEQALGFRRITEKHVHFGRPAVAEVDFDITFPVEAQAIKRLVEELANGV